MSNPRRNDIGKQSLLEAIRRMANAPFRVSVAPRGSRYIVTVRCRQTGQEWGQALDLADPEQKRKFRAKLARQLPSLADQAEAVLLAADEQKGAARRVRRQQVERQNIAPTAAPLRLADHFLKHAGLKRLVYWRGDWYEFQGACYRLLAAAELDKVLYNHLDRLYYPDPAPERRGELVKVNPNAKMVAEVRSALISRPGVLLPLDLEQPAWIDGAAGPDPSGLLMFPNGVLDLQTGRLASGNEHLFVTSVLGYDYDPQAPAPARWHKFLAEVFEGDEASIPVLQDLFGYILSGDRSLQKILLMIGGKRSGKGTSIRVLTALLGATNVCNPSMGGMASQFGLSPLIGKKLAVITDARLSNKADLGRLAETLLCISGEDDQTIDRKFRDPWTGRLQARVIIASNGPVPMSEVSGALASRFVVIKFPNSFLGRENPNLTDELLPELPGILLWGIEGLKRLRQRGHFEMAASGQKELAEIEDLLSPLQAFVKECTSPGGQVTVDEIYLAYVGWCKLNGREKVNRQRFGVDLRSCVDGLVRNRETMGERRWFYDGIRLNETGARLANLQRRLSEAQDENILTGTETERKIAQIQWQMQQLQGAVDHQNDPGSWAWRQKGAVNETGEDLRKMPKPEADGTAA